MLASKSSGNRQSTRTKRCDWAKLVDIAAQQFDNNKPPTFQWKSVVPVNPDLRQLGPRDGQREKNVNLAKSIESLTSFIPIFEATTSSLTIEEARWRPESGNWSILEIAAHLVDEEVEDFRLRVQMTLNDPTEPWPPIDPPQWALDRNYNEQDLNEVRQKFVDERKRSIEWLKSLSPESDWDCTYQHPHIGPLKAGQLMAAWTAHDWLHLRQIAKRKFELAELAGGEYDSTYAGRW